MVFLQEKNGRQTHASYKKNPTFKRKSSKMLQKLFKINGNIKNIESFPPKKIEI
jgi:hypothetical protein